MSFSIQSVLPERKLSNYKYVLPELLVYHVDMNILGLSENEKYHVGFEILTVVVMKSSVFWDITSYSPLKIK
jgi:hypothetical protein